YVFLIRQSDNATQTSTFGGGFLARIPSSGFFVLPTTGTYVIEVTSTVGNATGNYTLTLGDPTTQYAVAGTVTNNSVGVSGVPMTFSVAAGGAPVPAAALTNGPGVWTQPGFKTGTVYRVPPSLSGFVFNPTSRDFAAPTSLNFTATAIGCAGFTVTPITVG